jgi:manganese transport protein
MVAQAVKATGRALRWWGPAFAVSIGYVDPGNWATDLMAGRWGARLLWVVTAASVLALILQCAVTRLTVSRDEDLATAMGRRWPRFRTLAWLLFQGAAAATDLAEFTGIALGCRLLFHTSMAASVLVAMATTFILLAFPTRRFERLMMLSMGALCAAFLYTLHVLPVPWDEAARSWIVPRVPDPSAWVLIAGIVGATVMPHNLFLHSSLVLEAGGDLRGRAGLYAAETVVALTAAAMVNGGILLVGAGLGGAETIEGAKAALESLSGSSGGAVFAAALLIAGIAASATATLSGDYIAGGLAPWRLSTSVRRIATSAPAALALWGGADPTRLLLWSQVALALVLPAAVIPMLILLYEQEGRRLSALLAGAVAAGALCLGFDLALLVAG